MASELPKKIWVHRGCYDGIGGGGKIYDQRWFAHPVSECDEYVRNDGPSPEVLMRALHIMDDNTIIGERDEMTVELAIKEAQAAIERESNAE